MLDRTLLALSIAFGALSQVNAQSDHVDEALARAAKSGETVVLSPYSYLQAMGMFKLALQSTWHTDGQPWIALKGADTFNGLWVRKRIKVAPAFATALRHHFGAEPIRIEFTAALVNAKVKEETRGMIDEIISSGEAENTRFVFLNTLFLEQPWAEKFDEKLTKPGPFNGPKPVKAQFMYREGSLDLDRRGCRTSIVLPLEGGLKVQALLPCVGEELTTILQDVPAVDAHRPEDVELYFPRLKLNHKLEVSLESRDMPAFNLTRGDVNAIQLRQVAALKLDERGVKGAAATIVSENRSMPPEKKVIRLDRPFRLIVRAADDAILFDALVFNPGVP